MHTLRRGVTVCGCRYLVAGAPDDWVHAGATYTGASLYTCLLCVMTCLIRLCIGLFLPVCGFVVVWSGSVSLQPQCTCFLRLSSASAVGGCLNWFLGVSVLFLRRVTHYMRCIVVRGDALPMLLSPCNTYYIGSSTSALQYGTGTH